jgi:hypothetical protein
VGRSLARVAPMNRSVPAIRFDRMDSFNTSTARPTSS